MDCKRHCAASHLAWRDPLLRAGARKILPGAVCVRKLEGHTAWVLSVAWSSCGPRIASGARDGKMRVWRIFEV